MVKDRLLEVKGIQCHNNDFGMLRRPSVSDEDPDDFEEIEIEADHSCYFVGPLVKKYTDVVNDFREIQSNVLTLKSMLEAKNAANFDESEFNKLRQRNVQLCTQVSSKFKKLEAKLPHKGDFRTKARMQRALFFGYFQQYIQIWTSHEAILQKYEQKLKKNLQMQSKILNYDLTEEEIDTLIANKQTNMLMDNILTDTHNARQQLQEIKCRFNELMKLEKSISEVHGLFVRLQTLVVEQGEVMQRIEKHFDDAQNYISDGLEDIRRIPPHRIKFGLKAKILLIAVVLLVLLCIISVNSFRCFMFCSKKQDAEQIQQSSSYNMAQ